MYTINILLRTGPKLLHTNTCTVNRSTLLVNYVNIRLNCADKVNLTLPLNY